MQINTSKNIFLTLLLILLPIALSAQVGTRKYITRSGDTTVVVNAGSTGLHGEDAQFLFDSRASSERLDKYSRYKRLIEAADETEQVAGIVEVEKQETNPSSGSLGFRVAQRNIRYLQNEKKATRAAYDITHRDATVEELTFMKSKFGDKPSYFINGVHVAPQVAERLSDKDILTRSLKVTNTTTGNPNGEVWYVVNSKMFAKLGLEGYDIEEPRSLATKQPVQSISSQPGRETPHRVIPQNEALDTEVATHRSSISSSEYARLSPEQQQRLRSQQQEIEELKRQIEEVRRQRAALSGTSAVPVPVTSEPLPREEVRPVLRKQQSEQIVGFKDSPQERSRRERDEVQESSDITDATPKRSVRRIKERERNR